MVSRVDFECNQLHFDPPKTSHRQRFTEITIEDISTKVAKKPKTTEKTADKSTVKAKPVAKKTADTSKATAKAKSAVKKTADASKATAKVKPAAKKETIKKSTDKK